MTRRPISEIPDFPATEEPLDLDAPDHYGHPPGAFTRTLRAKNQAHLHDPALLAEWTATLAKTIAVDFDGTIHPYTDGWTGSVPADEPPLPGVKLAFTDLTDLGFRIVIFSVRADHPEGLAGIDDWLARYDLAHFVAEITHLKPAAVAYIDDRAVRYRGDWAAAVEEARAIAAGGGHGPSAIADPPIDIPSIEEAAWHRARERYMTDPVFHALVNVICPPGLAVQGTADPLRGIKAALQVQAIYDALDSTGLEIATKSEHVGYWRDGQALPLSAMPKSGRTAQLEFLAYSRPLFAHASAEAPILKEPQ